MTDAQEAIATVTKKAPRKARVTLSRKDQFRLTRYTLEEYTKSGLNDYEFAAQAGNELSVIGINDNHIKGIRAEFEIVSNTKIVLGAAVIGDFVPAIEYHKALDRISSLEAQVRKLFAGGDSTDGALLDLHKRVSALEGKK